MISEIAIEGPVSKIHQLQAEHREHLNDVECCEVKNFGEI
jgi:hypothetical protein